MERNYKDLQFQQREWRLEHVGVAVLVVLLVAAMLGVFGNGPLSRAQRSDGGLEVLFQRFTRSGAPADLTVTVAPGLHPPGDVAVRVSADYLSGVQVRNVSPEPDSVSLEPGFQVLHFTVPPGTELQVTFALEGDDIGVLDGVVAVADSSVEFSQLVYP